MPRHPPSEATLKASIATQLARLARLVPDDGRVTANPHLASWPGWMDRLVDDLVQLSSHDPLEALRGLRSLDDRVGMARSYEEATEAQVEAILDRQDRASGRYHDFCLALVQADPNTLVEQVFVLATEPGLLGCDEVFPQPLLDALGRGGREAVVRRLIEAHDTESRMSPRDSWGWNLNWSVTELLLADPDVGHVLATIDRLGLRARVRPAPVVRFLLRHRAFGEEFMIWMRRAIADITIVENDLGFVDDEEEARLRVDREAVAVCEAQGLADLAQEIRHTTFEILLDTAQLRDWLEHLPTTHRVQEEARALRHIAACPDRARALLALLEWPDLEAAARLVMRNHHAMDRQSCLTLNRAARLLEPAAPRAAMLLYRRAAFCQFSIGMGLADAGPQLARCAELWARHPDDSCESHAGFMGRLERERDSWR